MKKCLYLIALIVLLIFLISLPASAESTSAALSSAQVAELIQNSDPVGYNSPYSKENFPEEYIAPTDGSLLLSENILHLPGKNGFDVNLSATYNSNEIGIGLYTGSTRYLGEFFKYAYYYSYDDNDTTKYILIAPYYEEELSSVGLNSFYVKSIPTAAITDDFDIEFHWLSNLNTIENNILLTRDTDMAPVVIGWEENTILTQMDSNTERLNFSDIWKWNLPVITDVIYPTRYDYDSTYNYYKQTCAFVDLDGEYCELTIKYRKKKSNDAISNLSVTFADCPGEYTGYYTGEDIVDEQRGITYRCSITDSSGRTMFFTQEGFLCAAEDRFGNMIKYTFEEMSGLKGRILDITDTLGRKITFTYSNNDVSIYVAENSTATPTLHAKFKNTRTNSVEDTTNVFAFDDDCTSSIIRYENATTEYTKSFKYSKYHQAWYTMGDYTHHVPIECEIVKQVTHPNGLVSTYNYSRSRNIKNSTKKETYSVSERYDLDNNDTFNHFTYTYSPGNYSIATRTADGQTYTYNGEYRVSDMTIAFEDEEYSEEYHYLNRKRIRTEQFFDNGSRIDGGRNIYTRYSLNRPSRIAHDDYEKTISYFDDSSFVESEIYNQTEDVFVKTTYTLSEEGDDFYTGRTIDSMTVSESTDGGDNYTDKYTVEYTYNPDGTLSSSTVDPDGINQVTTYTYTYSANGSITTTAIANNIKDAENNSVANITTSTTIDRYGRLISSTDGNGNETAYEYDLLGRLIKVINPDDTTVTYAYDTLNRTTIVTDENGIMKKTLYDAFGNVLATYKNVATTTNPRWIVVAEYEYDALCRPSVMVQYTGYNTRKLPTKWIETHYTYGALDNVSEVAAFDENGTELSKQTYTYNTVDRLTTLNTSSPSWAHDNYNSGSYYQFTSVTVESTPKDGITPPTVKQYLDRQGRLCKQITTDGDNEYIATYTYDALGNVLEYKDEAAYADYDVDYSQKYEYNYNNQVIKAYNADENYITNTYDVLGRQLSTTDYMGNTTTYTYDSIGRMLTKSAPVDTDVTGLSSYYYNANGNTVKTVVSAAAGDVAYTYSYDNRNRLVSSFNGSTYTVNQYDGNQLVKTVSGLESSTTDISELTPLNSTYNVTDFAYDNFGNLISETTFNGTTSYTYDLAGNTLTTTDPKGQVTYNTYDSRSNLLESVVAGDVIEYEYNSFNYITLASRNNVATTYAYDNFGRNISEVTGDNSILRTYNTAGQVETMLLKKGTTTLQTNTYEYNILGNMTSASDGVDTVVYEYNENGFPTTEEKSGLITEYEYTPGNLMKSTTHSRRLVNDPTYEEGYNDIREFSSFVYSYYPDGNVKTVSDTRGSTTYDTIYGYDAANRLTIANTTNNGARVRTWGYNYNNRGDRTSQTVTDAENVSTATIYTYTNHRLTSENTAGNVTEYRYDANGNTIAKLNDSVTYQYTYTPRNEVASVTTQSGTYTYTYNASSLRTSKTANGVTTSFIWAGDNIVREETPDKSTDYFYGVNRVSRTVKGDAYTYNAFIDSYYDETLDDYVETVVPVNGYHEFYAYDGRGNVVHTMAIDSVDLYLSPFYGSAAPFPEMDLNCDGEFDFMDLNTASVKYPIVQNYYYSPFGEIWQGERSTDTNPFRYAGEYLDNETGDIYLRARYYDPSIGRFISVDPIKDGTNWYVYCSNNPIAFVDPSGLDARVITASTAVGGLGHTSLLLEDESTGKWSYYYFGPSQSGMPIWTATVILVEVPDSYTMSDGTVIYPLDNIDDLNKWLVASGVHDENSFNNYDKSVYIEGDFTESIEHAQNDVEKNNGKFDWDDEIYLAVGSSCATKSMEILYDGDFSKYEGFWGEVQKMWEYPSITEIIPVALHESLVKIFGNSNY
ncbi:MAG: RHS repeat-associated core domain-containing protein [Clostridia bacterium]|nr:RHS repeat-associated core domain-containing protein [Clostridia bacterium]